MGNKEFGNQVTHKSIETKSMKKFGFFSMFAAALFMVSCSNVGDEPGNDDPGTNDEPSFVEPAGEGTEESPYNVSKALLIQDGNEAWVKGYIVGQVAGSDITAESEFAAPFHGATYDDGTVATEGTNILIAASANETSHSACLVVQLPSNKVAPGLRSALELVNNPTNDGKEVELYGKLTKYFGVAGMKETSKAKFDGTVIGGNDTPDTPVNPGVGKGTGTKEDPYNVAAAQAVSDVKGWVKAYIVGQVAGDWDKDMQYNAPFTGAANDDGTIKTYGTNLLIADDANANTTASVMPVQLPSGIVRVSINLVEHPEMDGKEVLLYGTMTKYFGVAGLKEVECAIVDGQVYGVDPTDVDVPEGTVIFEESFATSQGNFTINNVVLPSELTYVWTPATSYKCMKASAYKGKALEAESWLISPVVALNGKAATLTFEHASKFAANNASEMRVFCTTDDGANWTELSIPTYSPGEYAFVPSGSIALPAAENVKVAFVYNSTTSNACTWEVKNVKIYQ